MNKNKNKKKKNNNSVENDSEKSLKRPYSNNGDEAHPKEKASKLSNSSSPTKIKYEPKNNSVSSEDQNKSIEPKPYLKRKTDTIAGKHIFVFGDMFILVAVI